MGEDVSALAALLRSSHEDVLRVARSLDGADLARPTRIPGWTVKDVLAHLVSGEPALLRVARGMLQGVSIVPPDFDLDRWNQGAVAKRREATHAELLEALVANRAETLALLGEIGPDDLERRGRHPLGREVSLRQLFEIMARHEREHAEHIAQALPRPAGISAPDAGGRAAASRAARSTARAGAPPRRGRPARRSGSSADD